MNNIYILKNYKLKGVKHCAEYLIRTESAIINKYKRLTKQ